MDGKIVSCGTYQADGTSSSKQDECNTWFLNEKGRINDDRNPTKCWKPSEDNSTIKINDVCPDVSGGGINLLMFDFQPAGLLLVCHEIALM